MFATMAFQSGCCFAQRVKVHVAYARAANMWQHVPRQEPSRAPTWQAGQKRAQTRPPPPALRERWKRAMWTAEQNTYAKVRKWLGVRHINVGVVVLQPQAMPIGAERVRWHKRRGATRQRYRLTSSSRDPFSLSPASCSSLAKTCQPRIRHRHRARYLLQFGPLNLVVGRDRNPVTRPVTKRPN